MSKRTSIVLEEVIKLHRFAGISPEKALTEAGRLREAVVAADQSMVVRCFGDDLACLVDDDFYALPPVQRPLGAGAMLRDLTNLPPAPALQCISYCHARHRSAPRGSFTFVCVVFGSG